MYHLIIEVLVPILDTIDERHMMKKKRWIVFPILIALIMGLTGCAENQIPAMTDEQIYEVSEYVAITLMKYDAGNRSRLVELDENDWVEKEPVVTPEPEDTGMKPVEDTPVIDATTGENEKADIESVLALADNLELNYLGYELADSYPKDSENAYFSLTAASGKQLLVLKFLLHNTAEQDVTVDLLSSDESFTLTVNEEYSRRALTTMLDNDLSTYVGVLKSGESKEVVLIIEVDAAMAGNITSLSMKVQSGEKKHTIRVQ